MSWKEVRLTRTSSSESDVSTLTGDEFTPMPKSKMLRWPSVPSCKDTSCLDIIELPELNENSDYLADDSDTEDSPGSDDVSCSLSVLFTLSDCESIGTSVKPEQASCIMSVPFALSDCDSIGASINAGASIITPTAPEGLVSFPSTPMASSSLQVISSSMRLSAVKWSTSLFMPSLDDSVPVPCPVGLFATDLSGDPLLSPGTVKAINHYPYDLVSPVTKEIIDETIEELFGGLEDDMAVDDICFDDWEVQTEETVNST